ncbi:T9SS type A sorting domain-containing protein [Flavobacterium sp. PL02]|uniref:T9SS type A sorting domain-containing protein n=1 Tax=Flavobacterium sp. PL02 TaxID=3088354 RepID=UPI002B22DF16|nr:T9SS type A sorting domain-containing protein [Flavobacterium sp. PL02]MEA9413834.1 T9SS type A sorting domain-containing protein [Flavobacterium sp. PL02]
MKKTLLYLFFLLTSFNFYAQSVVSPIVRCNGDSFFDLTIKKDELLGDFNSAETTISYHLSKDDATNDINAIPNPTSFVSTVQSYSIYARINNKGNITLKFFRLNVSPPLAVDATIRYSGCYTPIVLINATGGVPPFQYSMDGTNYQKENFFYNKKPGTHTIYTKDSYNCTASSTVTVQDITIPPLEAMTVSTMIRCNGDSNAEIISIVSGGTPPYKCFVEEKSDTFVTVNENRYTIHNMPAGMYRVVIEDAMRCAVIKHIEIQEPKALRATAVITDQTITVNATGGVNQYTYAISPTLYKFTENNTFTNLEPGTYEILVRDSYNCTFSFVSTINPPAPLFEGKKVITLNLTAGQTLADINVSGSGIKWYSNATSPSGKTKKLNEAFLPLSTVLVDNTTYYASQTINGIESKERLAVTVKLNTLSNPDFVLGNFKYHPNPVKNVLSIENSSVIDEVTLFSVGGIIILDKKINNLHSNLDLSNVATGIYFLKVKSEGREKTIKIVKE